MDASSIEYKYTSNDDFIATLEEQAIIVNWVRLKYPLFRMNGYNRYMTILDQFNDVPECIWAIKQRIVDKEKLHDAVQEPMFRDAIGYAMENGELHLHKDPNKNGLIHTRFNVYLQIPEKGGLPIYDNKVLALKERTYICCRSGLDYHCCQKIEGPRERIVLSFGFLLPYNRVENIVYEY